MWCCLCRAIWMLWRRVAFLYDSLQKSMSAIVWSGPIAAVATKLMGLKCVWDWSRILSVFAVGIIVKKCVVCVSDSFHEFMRSPVFLTYRTEKVSNAFSLMTISYYVGKEFSWWGAGWLLHSIHLWIGGDETSDESNLIIYWARNPVITFFD